MDLARLAKAVTRVSERGYRPRLAERAMRVRGAAHLSWCLILSGGCAHFVLEAHAVLATEPLVLTATSCLLAAAGWSIRGNDHPGD